MNKLGQRHPIQFAQRRLVRSSSSSDSPSSTPAPRPTSLTVSMKSQTDLLAAVSTPAPIPGLFRRVSETALGPCVRQGESLTQSRAFASGDNVSESSSFSGSLFDGSASSPRSSLMETHLVPAAPQHPKRDLDHKDAPALGPLNYRASLECWNRFVSREQKPRGDFLETVQQSGITPRMRTNALIVLSDLVSFHECEPRIFCVAVDIMDTFLAQVKVKASHLTVLSVASFHLATKALLDEDAQPLVSDLVANCKNEFTASALKRIEVMILDKCGWKLPSASAMDALDDLCVVVCLELGLPIQTMKQIIKGSSKFSRLLMSHQLVQHKTSTLVGAYLLNELSNHAVTSARATAAICAHATCDATDLTTTATVIASHQRVMSLVLRS